ncbi:zeta toxin family protein [Chitinophaga sp. RCC_12]|uniref:zeta toxin family protein n=1 Tax=Chitinophaga sp. RCC_12 TaxID=3239226 RepID=UPI0035241246
MPNLYIIAGCNGAGKTTASFTLLPEVLDCKEFVNADIIAADMCPFNPESVALPAGRQMLHRIRELVLAKTDFAFETTLATRSCVSLIEKAKETGYTVTLLFFWLNSPEMAEKRVQKRVKEGGHHIPPEIIRRRYHRGLSNLMNLYIPVCDNWLMIDNTSTTPLEISSGTNIPSESFCIWDVFPLHCGREEPEAAGQYEFKILSGRIMQGLETAMCKLVETNAGLDRELIIGDKQGNILSIPARDIPLTIR